MRDHEAFRGVGPDHLYPDCPPLVRSVLAGTDPLTGGRLVGMVDPLGTDICGMCLYRWKRKNRVKQGGETAA